VCCAVPAACSDCMTHARRCCLVTSPGTSIMRSRSSTRCDVCEHDLHDNHHGMHVVPREVPASPGGFLRHWLRRTPIVSTLSARLPQTDSHCCIWSLMQSVCDSHCKCCHTALLCRSHSRAHALPSQMTPLASPLACAPCWRGAGRGTLVTACLPLRPWHRWGRS
jgi:hypothetical protein